MALSLAWHSSEAIADTTEGDHDGTLSLGTVATDDIVVVIVGGTINQTFNDWLTPSKSSGTATIGSVTEIISERDTAETYTAEVTAWWFEVTAGGTLTINYGDAGDDSFGPGIIVAVATGADTTTPVTGAIGDSSASNNQDPADGTLGAAPVSGDYSVAAINWDSDNTPGTKGVTPGSGWTEAADLGSNDDYIQFQASYRTGSTSTTVDWPDSDNSPTRYSHAAVAFNIKAAAGGAAESLAVPQPTALMAMLGR